MVGLQGRRDPFENGQHVASHERAEAVDGRRSQHVCLCFYSVRCHVVTNMTTGAPSFKAWTPRQIRQPFLLQNGPPGSTRQMGPKQTGSTFQGLHNQQEGLVRETPTPLMEVA